jgi:hypothetical protein
MIADQKTQTLTTDKHGSNGFGKLPALPAVPKLSIGKTEIVFSDCLTFS